MARQLSRRLQRRRALEQLLAARDLDGLRAKGLDDPRVLGGLVALLNERDDLLRWRAIEGIGLICRDTLEQEEGLAIVREQVRRQLWSMNDESGNVPWHAAEAIGEMLYRVPALAAEFALILTQHLEMPIFRAGVLWAIARVAEVRGDLLREQAEAVSGHLADPDPLVRAHAALALGRLGVVDALDALRDDAAQVTLYDQSAGELRRTTVGQVAREAAG